MAMHVVKKSAPEVVKPAPDVDLAPLWEALGKAWAAWVDGEEGPDPLPYEDQAMEDGVELEHAYLYAHSDALKEVLTVWLIETGKGYECRGGLGLNHPVKGTPAYVNPAGRKFCEDCWEEDCSRDRQPEPGA